MHMKEDPVKQSEVVRSGLYPYDDMITKDGYLWGVSTREDRLQAVVVFDDVSGRFQELMSPENVVFVMRSRLCQLGVDCELNQLEQSVGNRIECTITFSYAQGFPMVERMADFLAECREKIPVGKLFVKPPHRRLSYEAVMQNVYNSGNPLIEAQEIAQGPDDSIILPVDQITYKYRENDLPSNEQIEYLLTQGTRRDIDYFRKRERSSLPLEMQPGGWVLTQLPVFRVREHFAVIEGITYGHELVPELVHASASLFDPLSYKEMATCPMIEVFNRSDHPVKFDGVLIRIYRPSKRRCSIQVSPSRRLTELLAPETGLRDSMDEWLRGGTFAQGKRIKHAAFLVDASEVQHLRDIRNSTIVPPGDLILETCPEYDILEEISQGYIKARGMLASYYFPRWDITSKIEMCKGKIHALIFCDPSQQNSPFFTEYDTMRLRNLSELGIKIYWLREGYASEYAMRDDCGFFMSGDLVPRFQEATFFACYGSSVQVSSDMLQELPGFLESLGDLFGEIGVVTGGGPGLMEAVNRIASGIGILSASCCLSTEVEATVETIDRYSNVQMFFSEHCRHIRQKNFSIARFPIFFPGGLGTLEEAGIELCNLKLGTRKPAPYVFIGSEYWQPIRDFVSNAIKHGMLHERIQESIVMVDSLTEAAKVYEDFLAKPIKRPAGQAGRKV